MPEKRSDSNDWLSRRRRDGQSGVAEPCSAQLRIDAPKARQRAVQRRVVKRSVRLKLLVDGDYLQCFFSRGGRNGKIRSCIINFWMITKHILLSALTQVMPKQNMLRYVSYFPYFFNSFHTLNNSYGDKSQSTSD